MTCCTGRVCKTTEVPTATEDDCSVVTVRVTFATVVNNGGTGRSVCTGVYCAVATVVEVVEIVVVDVTTTTTADGVVGWVDGMEVVDTVAVKIATKKIKFALIEMSFIVIKKSQMEYSVPKT